MLSEDDIKTIEDLAYKLTPLSDIALLIGCNRLDLLDALSDDNNPVHKAYYKGKARIMLEIRANEITLAQAGSPQAMQLINEYLNKMNSEE